MAQTDVPPSDHEHPAATWIAALYDQVYDIAVASLDKERDNHTLNPTALINEAFIRLAEHRRGFGTDSDFRAAVAVAFRRVLVDHARARNSEKRGGGRQPIALLEGDHESKPGPAPVEQYLALGEAIARLELVNERLAHVADLRIFGSMPLDDIARHLGVARRTVEYDWRRVRAFLAATLLD